MAAPPRLSLDLANRGASRELITVVLAWIQALSQVIHGTSDGMVSGAIGADDEGTNLRAVKDMASFGPPGMFACAASLVDSRYSVRSAALSAFSDQTEDFQLELTRLFHAIPERKGSLREWVLRAVCASRVVTTKTVAFCASALGDRSKRVRLAAIRSLGAMGSMASEAILQLDKVRHEKDGDLAVAAAEALARIGAGRKEALLPLSAKLKSEELGEVVSALESVGDLGALALGVSGDVIGLLGDQRRLPTVDGQVLPDRVCWLAMSELARLGPGVAPALAPLRDSEDWHVRVGASLAMLLVGGEISDCPSLLEEAIKDDSPYLQLTVLRCLPRCPLADKRLTPAVLALLESAQVSRLSARALAQDLGMTGLAALGRVMSTRPNDAITLMVLDVLREFPSRIPYLEQQIRLGPLQSPVDRIRTTAAEVLQLGQK